MKIYKLRIYSNQGYIRQVYMPNKTLCKQVFKTTSSYAKDGEHFNFTIEEEIIPADKGGMCYFLNSQACQALIVSLPHHRLQQPGQPPMQDLRFHKSDGDSPLLDSVV